jgi:peptidoglycan/xylan/chitin deacetylase (PgdA/CDA1 family)
VLVSERRAVPPSVDALIRGAIREPLCLLLRLSGLPLLIREVLQRRRVTILVYHRVDPVTADGHFTALRRSYTPISLQQYLEARRDNAPERIPPRAVIVTIDDGHESVYRLKPVLAKHQIPVTVFLCSGFVGTNRRFWFSAPGLDPVRRQQLKMVPDEARIAALSAIGFDDTVEWEERESLNVTEVRDLLPLVDFQSHTVSHPILTACSDEKATNEITQSKRQLEAQLGLRVNALAYPNGSYTERESKIARKAGYECSLTTIPGFNSRTTPEHELKRLTIRDECGINELIVRSCGLWDFLRSAARFSEKGRARRRKDSSMTAHVKQTSSDRATVRLTPARPATGSDRRRRAD